MNTLEQDILGARFGTKHRAELLIRFENIKQSVKDILWMARRYQDGRKSYALSMYESALKNLIREFGENISEKDPILDGDTLPQSPLSI